MSGELKRALYRLLMMIIALFLKIIVVQDLFIVVTRAIFGYNNISSLLSIVLSSVVTGVIIGEMMFCKERDSVTEKKEAIEYFTSNELTAKSSRHYILKVKGQTMDFILLGAAMFILLMAIYTIRMITTDWKYIFEAVIVYAVAFSTAIVTELVEKHRLYYSWLHAKEFDD